MPIANILVVEDEPVIALDIKQRLTHLGYRVVALADCAEVALAAVEQFLPDLVLMDIRIRGSVDGIETAVKIREHIDIPIVFLTAHADSTTLKQVKATQPFGYIVKPFETHDLTTAIEIALSRHQAETAIRAALNKEKELNELKSRFVSIVSHEFRNPLSSILFSLDLLERQEQQLTPEKKQTYFQRARASVDRMRQLLEEVLVIGEAEAGKLTCHPAPLDLFTFCHELVDEFRTNLKDKHAILFKAHSTSTAETVFCFDANLLRHILTNLLSNAIKYSPDGSKIQFDLMQQPDSVTFQIQDHGIGIPAEDQIQLFAQFHRGTNVHSIPGTGLGLSIVKQCVDAHHGRISVESRVGVGTIFTVTLPCGESEEGGG